MRVRVLTSTLVVEAQGDANLEAVAIRDTIRPSYSVSSLGGHLHAVRKMCTVIAISAIPNKT